MNRDSVWEKLKNDKTMVYGEPIMDAFLRMVVEIEPRHMRELDDRRKDLVKPDARLLASSGVEEAEAAIRAGAKDLNAGAFYAAYRGNIKVLEMLLDLKKDDEITLANALNGSSEAGLIDVVRYIVDRARRVAASLAGEGLSSAAIRGRKEVFEYLYDELYAKGEGPRMEAHDLMGYAIRAGSARVAHIVMRGVEDEDLHYLLEFAKRKGRSEIAQMISRRLDRHDLADRDEI